MPEPGSSLEVRPWQAGDRETLLRLCQRLLGESAYAFLPRDESKLLERIDTYLGDHDRRCALAALENGVIIGLLAGYISEYAFCHERIACDEIIYVIPERRGTGAAPRLLRALWEWARERRARELAMGISSGIDPARTGRFFERMGLEFAGGLYKKRLY